MVLIPFCRASLSTNTPTQVLQHSNLPPRLRHHVEPSKPTSNHSPPRPHPLTHLHHQTSGPAQQVWRNRTQGFLTASLAFFTGPNQTIMYESACEPPSTPNPNNNPVPPPCNTDQRSFKAYLSRWLAATTKLAPWTAPTIMPYLRASALAAAQSCSGGSDGVTCGQKWWGKGWDGVYGVGEQMSALEVIQSNLVGGVRGPLSGANGGTSRGDAGAGGGLAGGSGGQGGGLGSLDGRDRGGAIALTVLLVLGTVGAAWYVS